MSQNLLSLRDNEHRPDRRRAMHHLTTVDQIHADMAKYGACLAQDRRGRYDVFFRRVWPAAARKAIANGLVPISTGADGCQRWKRL